MTGAIHPYTAADIATAAHWLPFLDGMIDPARPVLTGDEADACREALDKLERRGLVSASVSALLAETYAL